MGDDFCLAPAAGASWIANVHHSAREVSDYNRKDETENYGAWLFQDGLSSERPELHREGRQSDGGPLDGSGSRCAGEGNRAPGWRWITDCLLRGRSRAKQSWQDHLKTTASFSRAWVTLWVIEATMPSCKVTSKTSWLAP